MIKFTIPGEPKGKGRPRVNYNKYIGRTVTHTPKETIIYENWVRDCFMAAGQKPILTPKVPLFLELGVYMAIAASASEKKKGKMRLGAIMPTKKPDMDNIVKAVCDSLNHIAYHDDAQICDLIVKKRFSDTPRVEVKIYESDLCLSKGAEDKDANSYEQRIKETIQNLKQQYRPQISERMIADANSEWEAAHE